MSILATLVIVCWGVTAVSLIPEGYSWRTPRLFTSLLFFWGLLVSSVLSIVLAFFVIVGAA